MYVNVYVQICHMVLLTLTFLLNGLSLFQKSHQPERWSP